MIYVYETPGYLLQEYVTKSLVHSYINIVYVIKKGIRFHKFCWLYTVYCTMSTDNSILLK